MPDSSPVYLLPPKLRGRLSTEVSWTAFRPTLPRNWPISSGLAVLTLSVAPMPPVGNSARPVLCTSIAEIASAAMLAKSNEREFDVPPPPGPRLDAGIWRPLSSTRL